jgi:integrase
LRIRDVKDHTITVRASVTKVTGTGFVEGATKTHRTRWVPVPEVVWDRLEYAIITDADKPDRLVFPGRNDGYLTDFEYRHRFDQAAKEIGVPGLTPHELRHTCASLAISAGANIKAVQRLLGHETAAMTLDEYGHLFSDDLTAVAKSLDAAANTAMQKAGKSAR